MKVVGDPNANVDFKAASSINKTIPKDEFEVGDEGVLTSYLLIDLYSFLKVLFLTFTVNLSVSCVNHDLYKLYCRYH